MEGADTGCDGVEEFALTEYFSSGFESMSGYYGRVRIFFWPRMVLRS